MKAATIERPLFVLLLLCYVWPIELELGANVWAHMDQAAAIVEYHTLSIDPFMVPPDGPNTVDWSRGPDGRTYPAKAPGCAVAALPVMAILYYAESAAGIRPFRGDWFRRNAILVNWVLNSLASAVAMVWLLRLLLSVGLPIAPALAGVAAIGLGTTYYPYATIYYAHNPAANLLIAAAYVAFTREPTPRRAALLGVFAGLSVAFEYAAVFAVVVFGIVLARARPRTLVPYAAGLAVPAALLAAYHTAAFGGPAMTAYRFLNPRISPPAGELLRPPSLDTVLSLTVSPYRGLFFYSPVLLLAGVGVWRIARMPPAERRRGQATLVWSGVAIFILWFLFNASYYTWWGGWTAGSRYIIPGLVLLAPAVAVGFAALPRMGTALLAISIFNQLAISTAIVMVQDDVLNPLAEVVYPLLWRGELQRSNVAQFLLGVTGHLSFIPMVIAAIAIGVVLIRRVARLSAAGPAAVASGRRA